MFLKVLILLFLHECHSQLNSFEIDYIGQTYSEEEFKQLNVSFSNISLRDAKRIISYAWHFDKIDHCDFEKFACGHFYEYRAVNERYRTIGFQNDLDQRYNDFIKKFLKQETKKDEPKIFKIIKSFYKKCVSSGELCLYSLFMKIL